MEKVEYIFNSQEESKRYWENRNSKPKLPKNVRFGRKLKNYPTCIEDFLSHLDRYLKSISKDYLSASGFSVISSDTNTKMQAKHIDYDSLKYASPTHQPLVGIIALEEGVSLKIGDQIVPIPIGSCLLFSGNTIHQGTDWENCRGKRLHFYVDTTEHQASTGETNGFTSRKRSKRN